MLSSNTISLQKEDDFIEFHQSGNKTSMDNITIDEGNETKNEEESEKSINKKIFLGSSNIE